MNFHAYGIPPQKKERGGNPKNEGLVEVMIFLFKTVVIFRFKMLVFHSFSGCMGLLVRKNTDQNFMSRNRQSWFEEIKLQNALFNFQGCCKLVYHPLGGGSHQHQKSVNEIHYILEICLASWLVACLVWECGYRTSQHMERRIWNFQ